MTGRRIGYLTTTLAVMGPGLRRDDSGNYSRGIICPKFCNQPCPRNQRAQGRPGARRTRGLMCDRCNKMLHMSIQVWRKPPAFPAQWLYGLYDFVLVTGFLATIIGFGFHLRRLYASTGARDPTQFT